MPPPPPCWIPCARARRLPARPRLGVRRDRAADSPPVSTRAVFFDVDFTLIHPGPAFQGRGYADACARHGVTVDAVRFDEAVAAASSALHTEGSAYDPAIFVEYTCRIIEGMGGRGDGVVRAATDLYDAWAACQ